MSLMSEQLLKAGLVTEEQVKKASKSGTKGNKKYPPQRPNNKSTKNHIKAKKKEQSDLEKFYKMRSSEENKIKQEALRQKKEAALRKKEMNKKINKLITDNTQDANNGEQNNNAEIRYNFVVGTTIKYVFVTEEQQEKLANGELAITFLKGKRCIIPAETGKQILAINPEKVVINAAENKPA